MGIAQSPKIFTNGLVFYYDQNNRKSYKGPAIQNLSKNIGINNSNSTGISINGGTETINVPQLGSVPVKFSNIQNNYQSFSPNSNNCCPSPLGGWGNIDVLPSTSYTYAIVYRCMSGYTNPNYMYRYEYQQSGNSGYVTEGGVHTNTNRIHLGEDWYWAWNTFTTNALTNFIGYAGAFYYRYSTNMDKLSIAKVLITPGNYTELHPIYWPEPNITRANTEVLEDLVGSNSLTATNLTYTSDGTFSFNGSNSVVVFPENSLLNSQQQTVEVWIKTNATSQNGFWFEKGNVNTQYSLFQEGTSIVWRHRFTDGELNSQYTNTASYVNTSDWAHVVGTYDGSQKITYINGIPVNITNVSKTVATNTNGCSIGAYGGFNGGRGYWYNGNIAIVKIYNQALTLQEIRRNFNAMRGRFGI